MRLFLQKVIQVATWRTSVYVHTYGSQWVNMDVIHDSLFSNQSYLCGNSPEVSATAKSADKSMA